MSSGPSGGREKGAEPLLVVDGSAAVQAYLVADGFGLFGGEDLG